MEPNEVNSHSQISNSIAELLQAPKLKHTSDVMILSSFKKNGFSSFMDMFRVLRFFLISALKYEYSVDNMKILMTLNQVLGSKVWNLHLLEFIAVFLGCGSTYVYTVFYSGPDDDKMTIWVAKLVYLSTVAFLALKIVI